MASFGQRLRILREERQMSQVELARRLHLSNTAISQYETTDRLPEPRILRAIADLFGVSVDYLLGRTDVRQPAASRVADDELDRAIVALRGQLSPEDRREIARFIEWVKERRKREKGRTDPKS